MNIRTIRSTLIGALGVALALASGPSSATTFQLTDIGPSLGVAINASGQVTGFAGTAGNGPVHAFLWDARGCGTSARSGARIV
jgi:probable HAF family extracellular repeat protein